MLSSKVAAVWGPTAVHEAPETSSLQPQRINDVVKFSKPVRAGILSTIFVVTVGNAASLAVLAMLYLQNDQPDSLVWLFRNYFLYSESKAFLMNYSTFVAISYVVLSAIFGLELLRLLWEVISTKRFRVEPADFQARVGGGRARFAFRCIASVFQPLQGWYQRWHSTFGVCGPYFDLRLLIGELVEVSSLTVAAVSASESISNAPLNIVYAVVIFLNCIATTAIHRVFRTNAFQQRIVCLLVDVLLDFVWGTLLPIWMYVPIVKIYLDREHLLDYLDSFGNATREIERVLIISWKLYAISIIPYCTSCFSLLELHSAIHEASSKPISSPSKPERVFSQRQEQKRTRRVAIGAFIRATHGLGSVYGLSILILVLRANSVWFYRTQTNHYGCVRRVYPWFATKESFLSCQINCTRMGVQGSTFEVAQTMELFDEASLSDLFVFGCPGFEMPPKIQSFKRLMSIMIKNSTIVAWGEDSMLRGDVFEELRSIQLKRVEFVQDPVGLTGKGPIASSIEWMYMEYLDGSRVLSQVGDNWRDVRYLGCHACGLEAFPNVLYHMPRLVYLAVSGNDLPSIADDWIPRTNPPLEMLLLDGNFQLTDLPDSVWRQASSSRLMSMIATNLSAVPEWVGDIASEEFMLLAIATPVCSSSERVPARVQPRVVCS